MYEIKRLKSGRYGVGQTNPYSGTWVTYEKFDSFAEADAWMDEYAPYGDELGCR